MLSQADREAVEATLLFRSTPRDLSERLIAGSSLARFERGETIFLQNDPARWVFVVLEGWVKLYRVNPAGAEAVVGVFTRGSSFAEAPGLQGGGYPVSAAAATDCRLLLVRSAQIIALTTERPEMTRAMIAAIFLQLQGLVGQIEALKAQSGAQRVADFLTSLAPVEEGSCAVTLPHDKSLIAARLGMKPESLSRSFARLRRIGVHVQQNRAAIADVAALRGFSDEDRAAAWSRA